MFDLFVVSWETQSDDRRLVLSASDIIISGLKFSHVEVSSLVQGLKSRYGKLRFHLPHVADFYRRLPCMRVSQAAIALLALLSTLF